MNEKLILKMYPLNWKKLRVERLLFNGKSCPTLGMTLTFFLFSFLKEGKTMNVYLSHIRQANGFVVLQIQFNVLRSLNCVA